MSGFNQNEVYNSPMDVFSWATPQRSEAPPVSTKRKSEDDSGYASPCCITRHLPVHNTYDEVVGSPSSSATAKKRLSMGFSNVGTAESYSDFLMDASLYSEPMEVEHDCLTPNTRDICKDSLASSDEISNVLDIDFEIASTDPCLETPEFFPPHKLALSTIKKVKTFSPKTRLPLSAPSQFVYWSKLKRGRNLTGFEKVDFLYHLGIKGSYPNILSRIFNYLSDSDLSNVTMVSRTWRNVCLANTSARSRWHSYANERRQNRENLPLSKSLFGKIKRQSLRDYNHSTPLITRQPTSPPVSPSKVRFHMFQKEAKNLKDNEVLMECPRCSRPSACSPALHVGQCKSLLCQWKFCTICKTECHSRGECPSLTPATPTTPTKRPVSIGSKQSRRNLRRL